MTVESLEIHGLDVGHSVSMCTHCVVQIIDYVNHQLQIWWRCESWCLWQIYVTYSLIQHSVIRES